MKTDSTLPLQSFATPEAWEHWLAAHYEQPDGIWIKIAKKGSGIPTATYEEALDVALCYGWIDGLVHSINTQYYMQKFTPRRAKSLWSKRNIVKVTELITAGRMQPSGMAAIDAAKADGRWEQAYDPPSTMQMPADFKAALASNPAAKAHYETLNKTNVYAALWKIQTAKNPTIRQQRIEALVAMLAAGEQIH